jgi:predicted flavoprotein YhiN
VIATGGLSVAPLGASDFGYRVARQFGITIEEPRPGLVPLTLHPDILDRLAPLTGIAVDAIIRCGDIEFHENVLITHRGLSGPAVLQISSYWSPGEALKIDLLPNIDAQTHLLAKRNSQVELSSVLSHFMPKLEMIAGQLHQMEITPSGTEGFKKAEVTVGGVSTTELSSKTMESKRVPGLYFIGEVVDVTGQLGGFNFQWAWASAFAAGQYV